MDVYIDDVVVKSTGFVEHDRLVIFGEDEKIQSKNEPYEMCFWGVIRHVLGIYCLSARDRN
jgi:hypothetical protein